jgi:uncharacterized protein (UPF0276 family)
MSSSGIVASGRIGTGLSLMCEPEFQLATECLFSAGEVDVLEWSFDMGWGMPVSAWVMGQLKEFSNAGNLLGHGVSFSPFSGRWSRRQEAWLEHFSDEVSRNPMRWVSEHFGFMGAGDFHQNAPLPVPLNSETLAIGRSRLEMLAEVSGRPVGMENLAFAFSEEDVREQGEFLEQLLEPVNGFLLMDLHNVFCQACNFDCSPIELLSLFPLQRVRELHISGGSWDETSSSGDRLRRDTHDGPVPLEVFDLLAEALKRCLAVEAVILEQIGTAFDSESIREQFRCDYRRMRDVVHSVNMSAPKATP